MVLLAAISFAISLALFNFKYSINLYCRQKFFKALFIYFEYFINTFIARLFALLFSPGFALIIIVLETWF